MDDEEVFSLENLLRLLLKHEETLNKKVLISSPKDNNVALGETKTPFKKKFKHQKKYFLATTKKFEKKGNNNYKQRDGKSKVNKKIPRKNLIVITIFVMAMITMNLISIERKQKKRTRKMEM